MSWCSIVLVLRFYYHLSHHCFTSFSSFFSLSKPSPACAALSLADYRHTVQSLRREVEYLARTSYAKNFEIHKLQAQLKSSCDLMEVCIIITYTLAVRWEMVRCVNKTQRIIIHYICTIILQSWKGKDWGRWYLVVCQVAKPILVGSNLVQCNVFSQPPTESSNRWGGTALIIVKIILFSYFYLAIFGING